MHITTLSINEFDNFQKSHELSNFYQTINYAMLMAENKYDYELVGYVDDERNIYAASLILIKPIGIKCFYGYAPRGFLIDYNDTNLLHKFSKSLAKYFYEKNVIFIKINPNIYIGSVNKNNYNILYNDNLNIRNTLINSDYKKLKDNLYFESSLPRFNAIIDINKLNFDDFSKNNKNKIKKGIRKGLYLEKVSREKLSVLKEFDPNFDEYFYKDFYTVFEKDDNIDLFLVAIDYNTFLNNSEKAYNKELKKNGILNEKLAHFYSERLINSKMSSDRVLLSYKNDIMEATKGLADNKKVYLAGALVVKHNDTATIVYSAYNKNYKRFSANYFLYFSIIKYYKDTFIRYIDLNGIVGDFKNENPYTGLNRFKLGFNPDIYEYLGEYDLIIEPNSYDILLRNGILSKEFNKNNNK